MLGKSLVIPRRGGSGSLRQIRKALGRTPWRSRSCLIVAKRLSPFMLRVGSRNILSIRHCKRIGAKVDSSKERRLRRFVVIVKSVANITSALALPT